MSNNVSNGRELLCTFTFSDGRRCRLPSYFTEPDLCYFHAQKFRKQVNAEAAGEQIAKHLNTDFVNACDLSAAFAALFSATVKGYIKPKTTATLAYLGNLMLQTQLHAKQEFREVFTEVSWHKAILASFSEHQDSSSPASQSPAPAPIPIDSANAPAATHPPGVDTAAATNASEVEPSSSSS